MKIQIRKVGNGYIVINPNGGFRIEMVAESFENLIKVIDKLMNKKEDVK